MAAMAAAQVHIRPTIEQLLYTIDLYENYRTSVFY